MAVHTLDTAPVYPPLPTATEKAYEWISKMDYITSQKILSGFDYTIGDVTYHFSYGLEDQSNFAQANTSAAISMQLGMVDEATLIAMCGANEDGTLNKANLPVPLPTDWQMTWQGHVGNDSIGLPLDVSGYLKLSGAAGIHNTSNLSAGWVIKEQLRNATTVDMVAAIAKEHNLEERYRQAREAAQS